VLEQGVLTSNAAHACATSIDCGLVWVLQKAAMQEGGGANRCISARDSKVAGSNITPFKDVGGQDSLLSSHRGGEEPPKECIGRTRSKTVTLLLGAKVMGATSRDIGNQNGRAHANLVMGATARAAGRDKGKENVNAQGNHLDSNAPAGGVVYVPGIQEDSELRSVRATCWLHPSSSPS